MHLPKFDYIRARSVKEVCQVLSDYGQESRLVAGGTDLFPRMKKGVTEPRILVDLKGVKDLYEIKEMDGKILLGATVPLTALEKSPQIQKEMPILCQSAGRVGVTQVRNMGTIGGNLCQETRCWHYSQSRFWRSVNPPCFKRGGDRCYMVKGGDRCHAMFCGDMAAALMALDGLAILKNKEGERNLPMDDLYTGDGREPLSLKPEEFLSHVAIQKDPLRQGVYLKLTARQTGGFAIVGVATAIHWMNGRCQEVRIAATSVGSKPQRLRKVELYLEGKKLDHPILESAANLTYEESHPITFMGIGAMYRRKMFGIMVKRALKALSGV